MIKKHLSHPLADGDSFFGQWFWIGNIMLHYGLEKFIFVFSIKWRLLKINHRWVTYCLVGLCFFLNSPLFMKWHDNTMAMLGHVKGASSPATRLQSITGAQRDQYTAVVLAQEHTPNSPPSAPWHLLTQKLSTYFSGRNRGEKFISAPDMAARLMKRVQDYLRDHL